MFIPQVNDLPLCPLTHEEAVIFLRQAADTVKLRLYRDDAQTPIAATSPSANDNRICGKSKVFLRPEAINLLSDIAYRNKRHTDSELSGSSVRSNTSPRRLKRGNKSSSDETDAKTDSKSESNSFCFVENSLIIMFYLGFTYPNYIVTSQPSSTCSDSENSTLSQCSFVVQQAPMNNPCVDRTYILSGVNENINDSEFYGEDELWRIDDESDGGDKNSSRPSFLDLAGKSGSTPMSSRKPRFQFSGKFLYYLSININ